MGFDLEINIEENKRASLIVLNKPIFRSIINAIYNNLKNEENNDIVIEDNGIILKYAKEVTCINDYFEFDFKAKSIITNLYKKIEEQINIDVNLKQEIEMEIIKLGQIVDKATNGLDIEVGFNSSVALTSLLKLYSFNIDLIDGCSVLDQLLLWINLNADFKLAKLIIFINLHANFSEKEILEIYKILDYKKIKFLCIDSQSYDRINSESLYLIDEDLVEFNCSK